ncbi:sensor histidine kinase [Lentzea albidocapillata]|uniref:Signal transduction histidine kinase n=1 Tax=Lentzea albidocapillata TaxID=40571 RepID=A0A1W2BAG9_9PSEU|nr:sensor histidine kinase [Lentzea albidocapillata]SMC69965.1 Signal transduction histidine kinase [Lentzea albidocapillata]
MVEQERRWNLVWALAPYGLLAVATGVYLVSRPVTPAPLVVVAALAVWHWWFVMAHPEWWEHRTGLMLLYFAGLLAATSSLLWHDGAFAIFVPACYGLAFLALPGWLAYAGVLVVSGLWLVPQGTDLGVTLLVNFGVTTPMAILIGWIIRVMEREVIRRREMNERLTVLSAENARLQVLEERARVAREMHDTVAQGLTGIVTQLEVAEELTSAGDPVRGRIATARRLARDSLVEVRRSIEALRPGPLRDARLGEAVERAVVAWREEHGVPVHCTVTGDARPLAAETEVAVLRAAQEALANAGRHARAGRVDVTLSYMEDVVVLDVLDDGVGFDPSVRGFGLTAMEERVALLGGTVTVESAYGNGTAVNVTLDAR